MLEVTMMRHMPIIVCLLMLCCAACLCCGIGRASQLPSVSEPGPVPGRDPRLERSITVDATGIALKDLLRQVSGPEVTLSASPQSADLKLQLRLKGRPLRSLMTSLSLLLGGDWRPVGDKTGYRFQQSDEIVWRRRHWWDLFQSEHARALASLREGTLRSMNPPPAQKIQILSGAKRPADARADVTLLRRELQNEHDLFTQLPADLRERIAGAANADPYVGQIRADTGMPLDGTIVVPLRDMPATVQEIATRILDTRRARLLRMPGIAPPGKPVASYLRFLNSGVFIRASVLDAAGLEIGGTGIGIDSMGLDPALSLNQRILAEEVRQGRQTSPACKELAAYQTASGSMPPCRHQERALLPSRDTVCWSQMACRHAGRKYSTTWRTRASWSLWPTTIPAPTLHSKIAVIRSGDRSRPNWTAGPMSRT
jgi:hypothetical protein